MQIALAASNDSTSCLTGAFATTTSNPKVHPNAKPLWTMPLSDDMQPCDDTVYSVSDDGQFVVTLTSVAPSSSVVLTLYNSENGRVNVTFNITAAGALSGTWTPVGVTMNRDGACIDV